MKVILISVLVAVSAILLAVVIVLGKQYKEVKDKQRENEIKAKNNEKLQKQVDELHSGGLNAAIDILQKH